MADPYLKKAFDLGELPENIDLDSPPVTGFDYLYRVRLETKKCPKVVVSNIDTTQFICQQTVTFDLCNGFIRAAPEFEATKQWQEDQLTYFTRTRDNLLTNLDSLKLKFPKREFPKLSKKTEWFIYCLGQDKYEEVYGKKKEESEENGKKKEESEENGIKKEESEENDIKKEESEENGKKKEESEENDIKKQESEENGKKKDESEENGKKKEESEENGPPQSKKSRVSNEKNPPLLSIILHLDQNYVIKLLSYHTEWLKKAKFSKEQGEWLYALLLCLQKPLYPNTCDLLRSLSRVCSSLRSSLIDPQDETLKPLNSIITIISQYFDQKDMSDNFLKDAVA